MTSTMTLTVTDAHQTQIQSRQQHHSMKLFEVTGNLHNHTPYSDGALYHQDLARAALRAGIDFVIATDHNVWVQGPERVYTESNGRTAMLLTGEEIHDVKRHPQCNHLLIFGAQKELLPLASNTQALIDGANAAGGLCFLAHPFEIAAPAIGEATIPWEDWGVNGYLGLELWNYMSEFKGLLKSKAAALFYAYYPEIGIEGPFRDTLRKWDELLSRGNKIVGIGNADAHGNTYSMGPISRCVFPYEFLYRAVNTHVLLDQELSGDIQADALKIYDALRQGHCFVGYDVPHTTRGFRFSAYNEGDAVYMGDEIKLGTGVTLQATAPTKCEMSLIRHGETVMNVRDNTHITHVTNKTGAYRLEATIHFKGKRRGWIYSNPIYIRE